MPQKKKKQQRNGFYWFMEDLIPQLRREGHNFKAKCDVVDIALPRWRALPDNEKERFERIAREEKKRVRNGNQENPGKLDNQGQLISARVDKAAEWQKQRTKETKYLLDRWPVGEEFLNHKFYLVSFELLCHIEESDLYLPLEVAILEVSLADGITRSFQQFIDTGGIPLGYRYQCQNHSDSTHQIPIEGFAQADKNYRGIWMQMENFVNPSGNKDEYPPLFCMEYEIQGVESCMEWLHERACMSYVNRLSKIYHLDNMLFNMYERQRESASLTQIVDMLETSAYDYEANTRCPYHEELEVRHCALGNIKRKTYALLQALAVIYNFDLTPAHLPVPPTNQPTITVNRPSTVLASNPSNMAQGRGKHRPADTTDRQAGSRQWRGYSQESNRQFPARDVRYQDARQSEEPEEVYVGDQDDETLSQISSQSDSVSQPWARPAPPAPSSSSDEVTWPSLSDVKPRYAGRGKPLASTEPTTHPQWSVGSQQEPTQPTSTPQSGGPSRQPTTKPRVLQTPNNTSQPPPAANQTSRGGAVGGAWGMTPPQQPQNAPQSSAWSNQITRPDQPRLPTMGRGRGVWQGCSDSASVGGLTNPNEDSSSTVSTTSYQSSTFSMNVGRGSNGWGRGAQRAQPGSQPSFSQGYPQSRSSAPSVGSSQFRLPPGFSSNTSLTDDMRSLSVDEAY